MSASLRALLSGAIDYAGMFPPAELSIVEAAANYAEYQSGVESWMLGRFVCPLQRLTELPPSTRDCRIAVVGCRAESAEEFFEQTRRDIQAIAEHDTNRHQIELFEAPMPTNLIEADCGTDLTSFAKAVALEVGSQRAEISFVMFELPLNRSWQKQVGKIASALSRANRASSNGRPTPRLGLKLRMGGATAAAIPTSVDVASVMTACRDERLCWKATAGLHQPLPHTDTATAHGFLNLFAAAVLGNEHQLSLVQIAQILDDHNPAGFVFHDDGFAWRDFRATTEQIRATRLQLLSFGSCDFNEPREGLRELAWL